MTRRYVAYVCGGDFRPGPRGECPDAVHDYPEPIGYVDFFEVAGSRLHRGWLNVQCKQCGLFGWIAGRIDPKTDHLVPASPPDPTYRSEK